MQTETVFREVLQKRVVPNLFVNMFDSCNHALQVEPEDMIQKCDGERHCQHRHFSTSSP